MIKFFKKLFRGQPTFTCPECRRGLIEGGSFGPDEDQDKVTQEMCCLACGAQWLNRYALLDQVKLQEPVLATITRGVAEFINRLEVKGEDRRDNGDV